MTYCLTTILLLLSLLGCSKTDPPLSCKIDVSDGIVFTAPADALNMLLEIDPMELQSKERAKYNLLKTIACDRLYMSHESPDAMLSVENYYSRNKTTDSILLITYYYLGRVYEDLERPEEALESYLKAKSYAEQAHSDYWNGKISYNIGYLYNRDFDFDHAQQFIEEAIDCFRSCENRVDMAHSYTLSGRNHILNGNYKRALKAYEEAKRIYLDLDHKEGLLSNALAIANMYAEELDDPILAGETIREANTLYNNGEIPLAHYPFMSELAAENGNYEQAVNLLTDYVSLKSDITADQKGVYYYLISGHLYNLGEYRQAYDYLHEYELIMDSISYEQTVKVLQEVEKKYAKQELENEYKAYRKQVTYKVIILFLILFITIGGLIKEIGKRRRKNFQLQSDLDGLKSQMEDFEDLKKKLSVQLDERIESEIRLQEVLTNKMRHVQKLVDYLFLYENNSEEFKKKVRTAVIQAEKDEYFGELHQIVNGKYYGIVDYLKQQFPALSDGDINLCCLICFGFNNNQIGILLGHTNSNSVFNKRHKLRKKLGLWPNYESLEAYLKQVISKLKANISE